MAEKSYIQIKNSRCAVTPGVWFISQIRDRARVRITKTIATHLVILASLESQVLALVLDKKVSTPPAMAQEGVRHAADGAGQTSALAGLKHNHRNKNQRAQHLNYSKSELQCHSNRSFQAPGGEKSNLRRPLPDAEFIIAHCGRNCKRFIENPSDFSHFPGNTAPWAGTKPDAQNRPYS